ncbi:hypothetical protein GUITHDRAFT_148901 [Guillardia theta CCMP2712]|uniref:Uncharacterized protein n=1 Tax=Guillardia theta (strain CCMP2712) TaxID=905079 RepID=L1I702_GUITC|nr:hypothetical protein GUITHDRAFT_148901 [Guillardia theta CCMP2712]EKX32031.1 hypothetical protein GUITHDRAFT_148901 [Guillardia theta CCMP2712]|eukprot:XP_005819011.1 hypothetical protein GUITHDRAFT_148901 [Guillardia theta CCMP2712]
MDGGWDEGEGNGDKDDVDDEFIHSRARVRKMRIGILENKPFHKEKRLHFDGCKDCGVFRLRNPNKNKSSECSLRFFLVILKVFDNRSGIPGMPQLDMKMPEMPKFEMPRMPWDTENKGEDAGAAATSPGLELPKFEMPKMPWDAPAEENQDQGASTCILMLQQPADSLDAQPEGDQQGGLQMPKIEMPKMPWDTQQQPEEGQAEGGFAMPKFEMPSWIPGAAQGEQPKEGEAAA